MDARTRYLSGLSAEHQVAALYREGGYRQLATRWRGGGGELDLVLERDDGCVFVEVKASRTLARAARSLSSGQIGRLFRAAEAFLTRLPGGLATAARFDVALVDEQGRIEIIENALCA